MHTRTVKSRTLFSIAIVLTLALPLGAATQEPFLGAATHLAPAADEVQGAIKALDLSPAIFVENKGQWDESIRYGFDGKGVKVSFTDAGPVFQMMKSSGAGEDAEISQVVFSATFVGARPVRPTALDPSMTKVNFYRGNDPSKWQSDVPTFAKVAYKGLYDGVDLYTWGKRSGLKYEFHVAPGASWEQIAIRYEGIEGLAIDEKGALHVRTPLGEIVDSAPVVYQETDGGRVEIASRFRLADKHSCGFEITGTYDASLPIVIDPSVEWGSYIGGSGRESGGYVLEVTPPLVALDTSGNAFVVGYTASTDFPTHDSFGTTNGGNGNGDVFVAKVTSSGQLAWAGLLGGSLEEVAHCIAVDPSGNLLVGGETCSSDFPTLNGFDTTMTGMIGPIDGFVAKITSSGQLVWSSLLGGNGQEHLSCIVSDASSNVLVAGTTDYSYNFPIKNAFDTTCEGPSEGFVAKVTPAGQLAWASFLGGNSTEDINDIVADATGNLFVVGVTQSTDFPTPGGFDTAYGGPAVGLACDAFVAKVTSSGELAWASYLGGSHDDSGGHIALDASGNIFVLGETNSSDFPALGAFCTHPDDDMGNGYHDVFVAKVTTGGQLKWASYLGGAGADVLGDAVCDSAGNLYIVGTTNSEDFPTPNGFDTILSGADVFIAKVSPSGILLWGTFLGGSDSEWPTGAVIDPWGNLCIGGGTRSGDFPASGSSPLPTGDAIEYDFAFTAKVSASGQLVWASLLGGDGVADIHSIRADSSGALIAVGVTSSSDFPTPNGFQTAYGGGGSDVFIAKVSGWLLVGPTEGIVSSFPQGGPSGTPSKTYTLKNSAPFPISYSVSKSSGWVSLSKTSGTLAPGASTTVTVSIGPSAAALSQGTFVDTVVFADTTTGCGDASRTVGLIVTANSGVAYLAWASFLGGSRYDEAPLMAVDSSGNAFIVITTWSPDLPTPNGFDTTFGGSSDVYIAKVTPSGQLIWASYLGGYESEDAMNIALDVAGDLLIVGQTGSDNFPTPNGFRKTNAGLQDGFVAKVSSSGQLLWADYLGGSSWDHADSIVFDPAGNIFVLGDTRSDDFPAIGGFDTCYNGGSSQGDVFIVKLTSSGQFLWSSYLGGNNSDTGFGIIDTSGNLFVVGYTQSADFPTPNGFDTTRGGVDAFVAEVTGSGQLAWASYLGGSMSERPCGALWDAEGNLIVVGTTNSPDFPTPNGFKTAYAGGVGMQDDIFIAKITKSGQLLSGSYLGGTGREQVSAVRLDASGDLILVGNTTSPDFPTPNGFDTTYAGGVSYAGDVFVARVTPSGQPVWASYLGGSGADYATALGQNSSGDLFIAGFTKSPDFALLSAFDPTFNGAEDAFVAEVTSSGRLGFSSFLGGSKEDSVYGMTFDPFGDLVLVGSTFSWDFPAPNGFDQVYSDGRSTADDEDAFVAKVLIATAKLSPLAIATASLPNSKIGETYTQTLAATGGASPYGWALKSGALPAGLSLDPDSGTIAGTPSSMGTFNFTVEVTDSQATPAKATKSLSIVVDTFLDADSDSLPDFWELRYFGSLVQTGDGDYDHDGLTNAQEYALGTDPTQSDTAGPATASLATVPTQVRVGIDLSVLLTATANDSSMGNSNVVQAEFFVGADPGEGSGFAMAAADGAFDSAVEALTATIDTSAWTVGTRRINVRARDAAGNWTVPVAHVDVQVVDGIPPGKVNDLAASAASSLQKVSVSVAESSASMTASPASNLLDGNTATFWQTVGTFAASEEYVKLDAGVVTEIGAVSLTPGKATTLFPQAFKIEVSPDGTAWNEVARGVSFKAAKGSYLWQFEPVDARYVRISGIGVLNKAAGKYCWQISDAAVYSSTGATAADLTWTAPADDGYAGGSASLYDLHSSTSSITVANFDLCTDIACGSTPKTPGTKERQVVSTGGMAGRLFFAIKAGDEVPNWSPISNVVSATIGVTGFAPSAPGDGFAPDVDTPPTFAFSADPTAKGVALYLSSCPGFPSKATTRADAQIDKTVKLSVKAGTTSLTPSVSQWKAIKSIVCTDGALYWRLSGKHPTLGTVFGPSRSMLFACGDIDTLTVMPLHPAGSDDAVWPDVAVPPVFSWISHAPDMKYFWVDVSTSANVPLTDKKATLVFGGSGLLNSPYAMTKSDWKKVRKLAATSDGVLYWRVRAKDAQKALTCASAVKTLIIDGGEWWVSDLELTATPPTVNWTCTANGQGIVKYSLQFSTDAGFPAKGGLTVKVPATSVAALSYSLSEKEVAALKKLAVKKGVSSLYYRVRGEDAEKAFITYSDAEIVTVP